LFVIVLSVLGREQVVQETECSLLYLKVLTILYHPCPQPDESVHAVTPC
jgi:hypothetical protein